MTLEVQQIGLTVGLLPPGSRVLPEQVRGWSEEDVLGFGFPAFPRLGGKGFTRSIHGLEVQTAQQETQALGRPPVS